MANSIRIVSAPDGEAPLWVREKWVGLELPLARRQPGPLSFLTSGVLSGPPNRLRSLLWGVMGRLQKQSGYAVDVAVALRILETSAPEAAAWWRDNVPRLQQPRRRFLFQASACQPLP